MTGQKILFVDDEEHLRFAAKQSLELEGLEVDCFADADGALQHVSRDFPGILVTDIRLPGTDGLSLMRKVLEIDPSFPVILVTGHGDVELAVSSMRDGAYDFVEKPFAPSRLVETVRRALDKRRLTLENRTLRRQVGARDNVEAVLHGRSAAMRALRDQVGSVAAADVDLLITGETGVGKEVASRAIHQASARGSMPFVHINCGALPANLVESELFGHEAGAFQGAMRTRIGRFEAARGGTVLLDEIDSLSPALQTKLLHALQNRIVTRLGSNEPVELDVRFIAATKKDLDAEVSAGRFRPDLLYRLNVVTITIPPLEARREDIPLLFGQLVAEAAGRFKRELPDVPGSVMAAIAGRDWPGNVRELRNAADRFVLGLGLGSDLELLTGGELSLADRVSLHEKSLIAATLAAHGGSIKDTYEALRISRKALYEKMQKYDLSRKAFSEEAQS
ncbi:sigma-54-dependent Fis family transcriptional regulator [Roseibium denhamense]|uniref:Two-component system, NtrC family, C4-dicarboxylate transport response regulator DctD n=1 Tax=Roseibium denhamense TaxID=76305 RepID=A0ABY1PA17_9HYPH|nr:sigma-54 dependent transcriptional regulator [Roseibium denhamense]MTI07463.1 sigma-54-dependent Fis family transcriptional regulator [Roseibium denhamense]SMP29917.1 two-component system, NtrC family, C4-dicarboxylate transport response regulator DctD [Roseibium denhamense]